MSNKKYLLISPDYPPPFVGGSLVYVHSLVQHCPLVIDVLTSTLRDGQVEIPPNRGEVQRSKFMVVSNEPSRARLILMYVYLALKAISLGMKRDYSAVLVNPGVVGNSILMVVLRLFRIPTINIAYAEEMTTALRGKSKRAWLKRFFLRHCYKLGSGSVVVCDFAKNILKSLGVCEDSIKVIPPTVSKNIKPSVREFSGDSYQVISVGRLIKRKGFHHLLDAINLLKHELPGVRLTIVGDGPEKSYLQEQIVNLDLQGCVELKSNVGDDELQELYEKASLFVLANLMLDNGDCEGAPIVFIEASASGMPVVGGTEGGVSTMIEEGYNGLMVDPRNRNELSSAIKEILTNPELRERMGRNGIEKAMSNHDPISAGKNLGTFIGGIVSSR